MKTTIIKVGYSTSIPIAPYGIKDNAWAEVEINLDGEEPDYGKSLSDMKSKVDSWVKENYPQNYDATTKQITAVCQPIPETQIEKPSSKEAMMKMYRDDMSKSNTLKELQTWKSLVDNFPEALKITFDLKHKELSK